jgi:sugar phosphate isomerase/epimerase
MRLAISNLAWSPSEDDEVAQVLQSFDVHGVELAPTKLWPDLTRVQDADLKAYRAFWQRQGIGIVALQSLLFGQPELVIFRDQATRTQTLNYLRHVMRIAARLGAQILVFGSPRNRLRNDLGLQRSHVIATEFFRQVGEAAAQHDVIFCIEPNPIVYGCDFIRTATEGVALVRAVNHPHFRLHLDAGGMTLSEELYAEAIAASREWMAHFHISEPQLAIIGEGCTDHAAAARALRQIAYKHWVSIEMLNKTSLPNAQAVRKALVCATEHYR